MQEWTELLFKIYTDPKDDSPICSLSPYDNCRFLLFRNYGQQAVCGFGENTDLDRRQQLGFIQPHKDCPLWPRGEDADC